MNSIIKITDDAVVDIILVRALSWMSGAGRVPNESGTIFVWFMRHDLPLEVYANKTEYLDFYTKWRNYTEWRLQLAMGEYENA